MVANASEGGLLVYLPERMAMGAFLKIEIFYVKGLELDTIKAVAKSFGAIWLQEKVGANTGMDCNFSILMKKTLAG